MPESSRRIPPTLLALLIAVVLVAAVVVIATLLDSEDDGETAASTEVTTAEAVDECANVHAGHGIAMWNATMADEMTAAGCPWPYDPFLVPTEGGQEDASFTAPFEARLYDELSQMYAGLGLGVCQVATLPDESVDGFTFGFRYAVGPPGCPDMEGDVALTVREYVTRPWRDAAANASTATRTLILGRWVIGVEGDDPAMLEQVVEGLVGLGGQEVTG